MLTRWRGRRERILAAWDRANDLGLSWAQAQPALTAARRGAEYDEILDDLVAKREAARDLLVRRDQVKRSSRKRFGELHLMFERKIVLLPFTGEPRIIEIVPEMRVWIESHMLIVQTPNGAITEIVPLGKEVQAREFMHAVNATVGL